MKLYELMDRTDGKENVELHVDGLELHGTMARIDLKYHEREIECIRLDSKIYLGIKIFLA